MATTNVTDWGVAYIDEDGVYHGGTNGINTGSTTTYLSTGDVDLTSTYHDLSAGVTDVNLTLALTEAPTTMVFFCTSSSNAATVAFTGITPMLNEVSFSAVGDSATLVCDGLKWICTSLSGTASIS